MFIYMCGYEFNIFELQLCTNLIIADQLAPVHMLIHVTVLCLSQNYVILCIFLCIN